jgi:hypothetical protein
MKNLTSYLYLFLLEGEYGRSIMVHMYVNGKTRPVKIIPGIVGRGYKGE